MTWFSVLQCTMLLVFVVCISDFRHKTGMRPLVNVRLTRWVKRLYVVPIGIYGYVLFIMGQPAVIDYGALGFTLLGLALAVKAKVDLGIHHTWAGYHFPTPRLVTAGLYRYLRHPMYTGIFLFICGALATIIMHGRWWMCTIACVASAGIMSFLVLAARRESRLLTPMREEAEVRKAVRA